MRRALLSILLGLGLTGVAAGAEADQACLRPDNIRHVSMKGAAAAIIRDGNGKLFAVEFSAPCGARHAGVFFVLYPQDMPLCMKSGGYLDTSSEGACRISSVRAAS